MPWRIFKDTLVSPVRRSMVVLESLDVSLQPQLWLFVGAQEGSERASLGGQDVKRLTDFPPPLPQIKTKSINYCIKHIHVYVYLCAYTCVPMWLVWPTCGSWTLCDFLRCQDGFAMGDGGWGQRWGKFCWETQMLWWRGKRTSWASDQPLGGSRGYLPLSGSWYTGYMS